MHFDPAVTNRAEFAGKIESLGYRVPEVDRRDEAEAEYAHTLGIRLLVAVVLTVPTVAISMVPPLMFTVDAPSEPLRVVVPAETFAVPAPKLALTVPPFRV